MKNKYLDMFKTTITNLIVVLIIVMTMLLVTSIFLGQEVDNVIRLANKYLVNNNFQRIEKQKLPKEIATVSYELLIPNLRDFLEEQ